jgi:F420-dependent oxidoreductase-like protein
MPLVDLGVRAMMGTVIDDRSFRVDIGIHYSRFPVAPGSTRAATLAATARVADEGGAALFTVMDHYFQMEHYGGPPEPMLEGYTTLGFVAGQTEHLRLGLLVTGVTYRHPGLLAKILTTLDVLSEGRAQLGLGAGWYEREHLGLGGGFPPTAERFERLEETLQVCGQMWSEDDGPFEGTHSPLAETICVPAPVQTSGHLGGPPVMLGGNGERKTLRMVAQYADATNLFGSSGAEIGHKLDVLQRHCDDLDRDYDSIRRTAMGGLDPLADRDAFLARMEEFAVAGIELVTLQPTGPDPVAWTTQVLDSVAPVVRDL